MKFLSFVLALFVGVSYSAAREHIDLFFGKDKNRSADDLCVAKRNSFMPLLRTAAGEACVTSQVDASVRVLNPQIDESQRYNFNLVRPFLIIDGIYLGTECSFRKR